MNTRLLELIKYKTGGRQNRFAELMGWTPPYLTKLLRGENFGLQPVITLLSKMPEVNARWFLLGTGSMLNDDKLSGLRREAFSRARSFLALDRFLPVMSADEIRRFEQALGVGTSPDFSDDEVARWEALLRAKTQLIESKVEDAISKSVK